MGLLNQDQWSALGLLGRGISRGDFSGGAADAIGYLDEAPRRQRASLLADLQMQEAQQRMQDAQSARNWRNGLDPASMGLQLSPLQAQLLQGAKAGAVPLDQLLSSLQTDTSPLKVGAGDSLLDRKTLQPLYTAPPKEAELPSAVREYEYAQRQGYRGTFDQWTKEQKRAGASNVSLAVNSERPLLNEIAGGLGKSITEARSNAQGALGTISTVNRLTEALDSNQVMAGPGTKFLQYGLQVGNVLGVGGKTAQEKLVNTRQAVQSLAQLELDAAQQMKGQGQITEAERSIIKRAAAGDVDSMTVPELRLLAGVLDRSARAKIRNYNTQAKPLMSNPNAAPLAPFLGVEEPPARAPAAPTAPAGGVRRYNPATGRIE